MAAANALGIIAREGGVDRGGSVADLDAPTVGGAAIAAAACCPTRSLPAPTASSPVIRERHALGDIEGGSRLIIDRAARARAASAAAARPGTNAAGAAVGRVARERGIGDREGALREVLDCTAAGGAARSARAAAPVFPWHLRRCYR